MRTVYQDEWLVVVDKPAGMASQSTQKGEPGVYEAVLRSHPTAALHHRLDQPASGLMLLGLAPSVNGALTAMFRDHTVERTYVAVLAGAARTGTWTKPIEGKAARTDVEVVGTGEGNTAVRCRLHTGRTHQIRIHAASAGVPIVGDRHYGGEVGRYWPRLALHAASLAFAHPVSGARIELASEVPDDLVALWRRAGGLTPG